MQKKYLLQINTDNTNKDVLLNELNKVDIKDKLQVADGIATVVGLESLKTGETVKSSIILEENNSLIKQLESLEKKELSNSDVENNAIDEAGNEYYDQELAERLTQEELRHEEDYAMENDPRYGNNSEFYTKDELELFEKDGIVIDISSRKPIINDFSIQHSDGTIITTKNKDIK